MNIEPFLEDRLKALLSAAGLPAFLGIHVPLDDAEITSNYVLIEATMEEEYVYRSGIYRAKVAFTIRTNPDTIDRLAAAKARSNALDVISGITPEDITLAPVEGVNGVKCLKWKMISGSRAKDGEIDVSSIMFETLAGITAAS